MIATCDRATVLRDGGDVGDARPAGGRRGGDRRATCSGRGGRAEAAAVALEPRRTPAARPPPARRRRPRSRSRDLAVGARRGRLVRAARRRDPRRRRARGPGPGRAVRLPGRPAHAPSGGEIRRRRQAAHARHPYDAIRAGVVLVPGRPRARAAAAAPGRARTSPRRATTASRRWGPINMRDERRRVRERDRARCRSTRAPQRQVRRLSGGNQQKVTIGRWLAAGFRTMLCFDPTRGIDVGTKRQIYALLRELADDGAAILFFSSELRRDPARLRPRARRSTAARITAELPGAAADEATLLHAMHGLVEARRRRMSATTAPRGRAAAVDRLAPRSCAATAGRSASTCCCSWLVLYWRSATVAAVGAVRRAVALRSTRCRSRSRRWGRRS